MSFTKFAAASLVAVSFASATFAGNLVEPVVEPVVEVIEEPAPTSSIGPVATAGIILLVAAAAVAAARR